MLSCALAKVHLSKGAFFLFMQNTLWSHNLSYIHKNSVERKRWVENFLAGLVLAESPIAGRDQLWQSCFFGRVSFVFVRLPEGGTHIAQNSPFHNGVEVIRKWCDLYLIVFKEAFNVRVVSYLLQNLTHFLLFVCLLLSLNLIHR